MLPASGTGDELIMDRRFPRRERMPAAPTGTRRFSAYFSMPERRRIVALVRLGPEKSTLLRVAKKFGAMRRFVDNGR